MSIKKNTFSNAISTSKQILESGEFVPNELDSLLGIYEFGQDKLYENLSGEISKDVLEQVIPVINKAVDMVVSVYLDTLKKGKKSIISIISEDILWNSGANIEQIINNPCSFLPDELKTQDIECMEILNNIIHKKFIEEIKSIDSSNFDTSDFDELDIYGISKILSGISSISCIDDKQRKKIEEVLLNVLSGKISGKLDNLISNFVNDINPAIENSDSKYDVKIYKAKFAELINDLENNEIVRGTSGENILQQCKPKFEAQYDDYVGELIKSIADTKLEDELDTFNDEDEIDKYTELSSDTIYSDITKLLEELNSETKKTELKKLIDKKIRAAQIMCRSKVPQIKITTDELGKEYARFETESFPVAIHKKVKHNRQIMPEELPNGHILITFVDKKTGKTVRPKLSKRLRVEEIDSYPSYEVTREEYMEILKVMKEGNSLSKEISKLREELKETDDKQKRKELNEQLLKYIEQLPFFMQVLDKLKILSNLGDNYTKSKIPDFDPDTIKITPDIMENLREMAECSKTMLLGQKDALIIQGEAGVGKNVLIDIFAHYTNRPVFIFACSKKTDNHDLTYLWVLDENGSKKLNSKVYEAIRTPGAILVLDEINTLEPGVIKMLNGLFDKRKTLVSPDAGGSDAKALPDVLLFGTMNPVGYAGTQQLPQDVRSRFHFITHDYDWMFNEDEVSYSDALRTYGNVNYFRKLVSVNGMRKQDVELYEQAALNKKLGNELTDEEKDILEKFKPVSDTDFIWAWNKLFNAGSEKKVIDEFGLTFVEGMKDIYTIVLYSNYIRMRHRMSKLGIKSKDFPWDKTTDDLFEEISYSPRLQIQALEQLNNGNEIKDAKQAVVQTYIQQVSDAKKRAQLIQFFDIMDNETLENALKDKEVQKKLSE